MHSNGLSKNDANYRALTPLYFLERAALANPNRASVIYHDVTRTWQEVHERCLKMASALTQLGIKRGETVAVLLPNTPEMLELHFAVPMAGAVLNTYNTRLDAESMAFMLDHASAKIFIVDEEYHQRVEAALTLCQNQPIIINVKDIHALEPGQAIGDLHYEALLATGDSDFSWQWPEDEWEPIALNYTSGTTGNPKGVVYHHRGAYLNALSNALALSLNKDTRYLWTLPMFHCNGWCFPWAVTAVGGTHICLRQPSGPAIFEALSKHGATHFCAAPVVLNMMANTPDNERLPFSQSVTAATGGAAPPSSIISAMESLGVHVIHLYGLTETYGPSLICEFQDQWQSLDLEGKSEKVARQGITTLSMSEFMIADDNLNPVPKDGSTIGELLVRGNSVMKGYLLNEEETTSAFDAGWFHTGDLGVWHEDGYVEIKDRSKDIIISGGENISTLEVENALYQHPAVLEAAVVACNDDHWGEVPCAFITLKTNAASLTAQDIITHCRQKLASYKCPKHIIFIDEMPKTSTGKFQKHLLRDSLIENREQLLSSHS